VHLNRPQEVPYVTYITLSAAIITLVITALIGFAGISGGVKNDVKGAMSLTSRDVPLHSIEIQQGADGKFRTADGTGVETLAAKIKVLPPEVPEPFVLVRVPASTQLESVTPVLKEIEASGIKNIAIVIE